MKHYRTLISAPLLCLGLVTSSWAAGNAVVATVNGKEIKEDAIQTYIQELNLTPEQAQRRDMIINELVSRELVHQEALKKGFDKREDVIAELARLKVRVLLNVAVREAMLANPVTEDEIKQEYQKQLPNMQQPEFKARHILVKTEDEAKAVIKALDKGGDFAKLAKEKSLDATGQEGGDLDWFNPNQMVPPFSAAVSAMKKGSYTKQPVQTQFGWHVIKLDDSRTAAAPGLDDIRPQLLTYLQQRHIAVYLEKLRTGAKVEIKSP